MANREEEWKHSRRQIRGTSPKGSPKPLRDKSRDRDPLCDTKQRLMEALVEPQGQADTLKESDTPVEAPGGGADQISKKETRMGMHLLLQRVQG
ncbi:hypothetical protein HAX54_053328 [Datura stramonium]|uniref:Uncharacterized protein n=1 Tax=Datura stramonium TaxID=4076 RepID=A0ABS8WTF1_DATST|nr:hypothetical protein [Datura stramonium]